MPDDYSLFKVSDTDNLINYTSGCR